MGENNKNKKVDEIQISLSIDEINTVLSALGNMPYVQVFSIIQKLHEQAGQQINKVEQQAQNS